MGERPDVVVIGAGVMGLATARALLREGRSVAVLEQFDLGHTRGSSHGASRIFRLAYENPEFVAMARAAFPLWGELARESGEELLRPTGSLDVGGNLDTFRRALLDNGVSVEMLGHDQLARRFPGVRIPEREALFHPDGGILRADRVHAALIQSVRAHGGELRERAAVRALAEANGGVQVETEAGRLAAGAAVVAAGSWAPRLLAGLGIDLPVSVTRETVVHFRLARPDGVPTLIDRTHSAVTANRETYALVSPGIGLKVGVHRSGRQVDPDSDGAPDPEVVAASAEWARERYDLDEVEPSLVETCLYTSTADERFVLERHGRVVVCSACSGHGFKFTPEVGRRTAALATEALAH